MDKITDKIAAMPQDATFFSLEFFPPKTAMGFANLRSRLERMARALRPTFINVTFGAGGSTTTKSLELAEICQRELGVTTCLHLTCTNMSRRLIDRTLEDAKALGVRNILALRGDPPRRAEYHDSDDSDDDLVDGEDGHFVWAIDLVKHIRNKYGDYFCIGVAAYPEGHADESHPLGQSLEHDLPYLVEKTKAGADFLLTQLFFDIEAYDKFETTLRNHSSGAFKTIPIIPGLMPIQNYQMIKRTTKLSHAHLPETLITRLDAVQKDDEKVKNVGLDILAELMDQIKAVKSRTPGPKGFHFYTLNLEKVVSLLLERTDMIPPEQAETDTGMDTVVAQLPLLDINGSSTNGSHHSDKRPPQPLRAQSSHGSEQRNRVIVSGEASNPDYETTQRDASKPASPVHSRANTLAISEGEGALGREATWDDFPNGRWGDARSPAYGEIDGYGVSLHMSVTQALKLWGCPRTAQDISKIFIRHLEGDLAAIPWSEEEFNPETLTIRKQLLSLNERGWYTVASQPAVNGLRSIDPTFGWGPPQGFVFQKAFVEFFLPAADWQILHQRLQSPELKDLVWFYAANADGDFYASDFVANPMTQSTLDMRQQQGGNSLNAVTWGVFPGKEIVTPTIIEEVSFRAWSEEAFGIWGEWSKVYGRRSESEKLLEGMRQNSWLVNIIHNDYVDGEALWDLLLDASKAAVGA